MSKMSQLYADIEEQLMNGAKPEEIARSFNVPIRMVYELEDDLMRVMQYSTGVDHDSLD